jgi:hypothetical protein
MGGILRKLVFIMICVLVANGNATTETKKTKPVPRAFPMKSKEMVEVLSYDPVKKVYAISNLTYWGQGPIYVTPEDLAKAIPTLNLDRILRDPNSILTNQYLTDRPMMIKVPSVWPSDKSTSKKAAPTPNRQPASK